MDHTDQRSRKQKRRRSKGETLSSRTGLKLPIQRIHNDMQRCCTAKKVSVEAAIFLAGVIEYMLAELINASSYVTESSNKERITPQHITIAIHDDSEMADLLKNVIISRGGVVPNICDELLLDEKSPVHGPDTQKRNDSTWLYAIWLSLNCI